MDFFKKLGKTFFGISVLYILLGIFLIVAPGTASDIICYILGGITIIYGLINIVDFIANREERNFYSFGFVKGVIFFLIGLFIVLKTDFVSSILPFVFGIILAADGFSNLQTAFNLKALGQPKWWIVLIGALLTAFLGIVMVFNPFETRNIIMMIIGISLIYDGASNLFFHMWLKREIKRKERES